MILHLAKLSQVGHRGTAPGEWEQTLLLLERHPYTEENKSSRMWKMDAWTGTRIHKDLWLSKKKRSSTVKNSQQISRSCLLGIPFPACPHAPSLPALENPH